MREAHWHDHVELNVICRGGMSYLINGRQVHLEQGAIYCFWAAVPHQVISAMEGTELVCATVEFGTGMLNPLTASFPEPFIIPLDALPELAPTLQLLFSESSSGLPGRQTALDRLFEYVLLLLFRSAMSIGVSGFQLLNQELDVGGDEFLFGVGLFAVDGGGGGGGHGGFSLVLAAALSALKRGMYMPHASWRRRG